MGLLSLVGTDGTPHAARKNRPIWSRRLFVQRATTSALTFPESQSTDYPWKQAIAQHGRRVVVALLARGIALHDAEEFAQEAWARLIAQRSQGQLAYIELPGLAIRQALFLLSDARRERVRDKETSFELVIDSPGPDLERTIAARQGLERAQRALEELGPRAREVFDFVYRHPEVRHEQAAATLGLSTQRLRQTLCEVRQRLRAAMKETP